MNADLVAMPSSAPVSIYRLYSLSPYFCHLKCKQIQLESRQLKLLFLSCPSYFDMCHHALTCSLLTLLGQKVAPVPSSGNS